MNSKAALLGCSVSLVLIACGGGETPEQMQKKEAEQLNAQYDLSLKDKLSAFSIL